MFRSIQLQDEQALLSRNTAIGQREDAMKERLEESSSWDVEKVVLHAIPLYHHLAKSHERFAKERLHSVLREIENFCAEAILDVECQNGNPTDTTLSLKARDMRGVTFTVLFWQAKEEEDCIVGEVYHTGGDAMEFGIAGYARAILQILQGIPSEEISRPKRKASLLLDDWNVEQLERKQRKISHATAAATGGALSHRNNKSHQKDGLALLLAEIATKLDSGKSRSDDNNNNNSHCQVGAAWKYLEVLSDPYKVGLTTAQHTADFVGSLPAEQQDIPLLVLAQCQKLRPHHKFAEPTLVANKHLLSRTESYLIQQLRC